MSTSHAAPERRPADLLSRVPPAAGAAVLGAALIALVLVLVLGGGDDKAKIPAGAVAIVGDKPITNASLAHWESVYSHAATSAQQPQPSAAQARKGAFALLAGFAFIENEAARRNVSVTKPQLDAAMNAFFGQYKNTPKSQILSQMGASEADLRTQQRIALLANALQSRVARAVPAPSASKIQAAYNAEPERWAHPSQRDVRLVIAGSQQDANAAKQALASGQSFTTVNKKYSVNSQLASSGGAVKGLKPGSTDPTLERAVFKAQAGQLLGPVKTANGWVVFKVQKVTPLPDQSLQQATKAIKSELTATAQSAAVDSYLKDMRTYWRERTHCADAVKDKTYCA